MRKVEWNGAQIINDSRFLKLTTTMKHTVFKYWNIIGQKTFKMMIFYDIHRCRGLNILYVIIIKEIHRKFCYCKITYKRIVNVVHNPNYPVFIHITRVTSKQWMNQKY